MKGRDAFRQNQAFSALLFLYQQVLDRKLPYIVGVERVARPPKLPVVFTRAEARAVLAHLKGDYRLMAHLLYGSGLRLLESSPRERCEMDRSRKAVSTGPVRISAFACASKISTSAIGRSACAKARGCTSG